MNAIKIIKWLSLVIFFIFYNKKWREKRRIAKKFKADKESAIKEANRIQWETGKRAFVVQNGTKFIVSTRSDLRGMNSKYRGKVKGTGLTFDYRTAIIYTAK